VLKKIGKNLVEKKFQKKNSIYELILRRDGIAVIYC